MDRELEKLRDEIIAELDLQFKKETSKNYKMYVRKYFAWCDQNNLKPLSEEVAVAFFCKEVFCKGVHEANRRGYARMLSQILRRAGKNVEFRRPELEEFCRKRLDCSLDVPELVDTARKYINELVPAKPVGEEKRELTEEEKREEKKGVVVEKEEKEGDYVLRIIEIRGSKREISELLERILR